jgi:hypothetical protein
VPLEDKIQAAAACQRSHDTGTEAAGAGTSTPAVVGVVALLRGIALLRRVVHLVLLAVVALLLRVALLRISLLRVSLLGVVALASALVVLVCAACALGRR